MKSIKASIALEIHKESRRVNRQICTKRKAAGLPVKLGRKITNFSPGATKRRASAKRAKLARDELQNVIKLLAEGAGEAEVALLKIAGTAAGKKHWPILAAALRDGENAQRVEAAVAQIVRQQGLSPTGKKKRSAHRGTFIAISLVHTTGRCPKISCQLRFITWLRAERAFTDEEEFIRVAGFPSG